MKREAAAVADAVHVAETLSALEAAEALGLEDSAPLAGGAEGAQAATEDAHHDELNSAPMIGTAEDLVHLVEGAVRVGVGIAASNNPKFDAEKLEEAARLRPVEREVLRMLASGALPWFQAHGRNVSPELAAWGFMAAAGVIALTHVLAAMPRKGRSPHDA